jgi:hypothetical protein
LENNEKDFTARFTKKLWKCDAQRALRGASWQLKLIFHFVLIHFRLQGEDESSHSGKLKLCIQTRRAN